MSGRRASISNLRLQLGSGKKQMIETETVSLTVEQCRWFYAEELRVVANLTSTALVGAFARVERERYMGQPPWQFSSQAPTRGTSYRTTEEVRDLYHDIFIALKSEK